MPTHLNLNLSLDTALKKVSDFEKALLDSKQHEQAKVYLHAVLTGLTKTKLLAECIPIIKNNKVALKIALDIFDDFCKTNPINTSAGHALRNDLCFYLYTAGATHSRDESSYFAQSQYHTKMFIAFKTAELKVTNNATMTPTSAPPLPTPGPKA